MMKHLMVPRDLNDYEMNKALQKEKKRKTERVEIYFS